MHYFTIRDIENLCGIKAHTLRIWEQRYRLFTPKRRESNHRLYDNEDLKQMLRIAYLYGQGWKISRIAQLSPEQILQQVHLAEGSERPDEYHIMQLIGCAVEFDKEGFSRQLDAIIQEKGVEHTILQVCYPLLQKIGLLWMTNHVLPAQEHFCSYIIEHKIIAETDKLPLPSASEPQILLFCPQGEYHQLPLFFINYLLRQYGWSTLFLGSSVQVDLIRQFTESKPVHCLFLHLITNFTGLSTDEYLEDLVKAFPGLKIVASGSSALTVQRNFTSVQLLRSDAEIYRFIRREA